MKNFNKIIATGTFLLIASISGSQTINWAALKPENRHIVNVNAGMEYGLNYGVGYGYYMKTKYFSILPTLEYSFPSGGKLFDDFKTKAGGQIRWVNFHNFQFSTKIHGVFRRYDNDFARLTNFGSDLSAIAGYYRSKWFVAAEIGFDKAIVTHFKLGQKYRDLFGNALNGWYEPPTAGNVYYGLQVGYTLKDLDITLKAGKIVAEDFKSKPTVPFYTQIGCNWKF